MVNKNLNFDYKPSVNYGWLSCFESRPTLTLSSKCFDQSLFGPGHLRNDLIGVAFNWAKAPVSDARSEYNLEEFYRFPIFPHVDTTLSSQSVIDPAFDPDNRPCFSVQPQTSDVFLKPELRGNRAIGRVMCQFLTPDDWR